MTHPILDFFSSLYFWWFFSGFLGFVYARIILHASSLETFEGVTPLAILFAVLGTIGGFLSAFVCLMVTIPAVCEGSWDLNWWTKPLCKCGVRK